MNNPLGGIEFIDYRSVDWHSVRRTRSLFYQRFHYNYPGPIHNLKQRLVVLPADHYGTQKLRDHYLAISPAPAARRQTADPFGNRILELEVPEADGMVSFDVLMIVESESDTAPIILDGDIGFLLQHTKLTAPDIHIETIAYRLRRKASTPHDLAQRINDWVYAIMQYQSGVTTVATTAAEALALRQGLCQDYSHLMISICRAAGLPARYVSGHLLGEGGSHAWVEVFLPTQYGISAFAFDPTNNRQPHLGYITVAVGRDYRDVSPTSGSFTAPYSGQLTCSKQAGLTLVEYFNGDILTSDPIL